MDIKKEKKEEIKKTSVDSTQKLPTEIKNNYTLLKVFLYISLIGGMLGVMSLLNISGVFAKSAFIYTGIILTFVFLILNSLKKNEIILPNNIFLYVLPILPIAYLISSLLNPGLASSLVGLGVETGTVSFIVAMSFFVILITVIFRKKIDIIFFQIVLFALAILLLLVQVIRIFFPSILKMNELLTTPLSNFIGNLNDLGVFFGAILILVICATELSNISKTKKAVAYLVGLLSMIILAVSGFTYLWIIIGLFSLLIFVSLFSFSKVFFPKIKANKLSYVSLVTVLVSAVFIIFGTSISKEINNFIGASNQSESYPPSIEYTLPVVKSVFKNSPVLGVGPNRFDSEWVKSKPLVVNTFSTWNIDYKYGNSVLLTSLVNVGILGTLAWLIMFGLLVYLGVKYLFVKGVSTGLSDYITFSSFILAVYLWLTMTIHIPSQGIFVLTFMSTGLFISSLYASGLIKERIFRFNEKPAMSFTAVMVMVLMLIGSVAYEYVIISKVYASYNYNKAVSVLKTSNTNKFEEAKIYAKKATSFGGNDIYYRGLSSIYLSELEARAGELTQGFNDKQKSITSDLFENSIAASVRATEIDGSNYQNYVSVANAYKLLVSPSSKDHYIEARKKYDEAIKLNPTNPSLMLAVANIELLFGNRDQSIEYINKAIALKPNFGQARIFLANNIYKPEGKMDEAIKIVEIAAQNSPNDFGVQIELGKLRFEDGDFKGAVGNFENVLRLVPSHANARYYLALSLDKLGRKSEAIDQLMIIKQIDPASQSAVDQTINEIRNGKKVSPEPLKETSASDDSATATDTEDIQ